MLSAYTGVYTVIFDGGRRRAPALLLVLLRSKYAAVTRDICPLVPLKAWMARSCCSDRENRVPSQANIRHNRRCDLMAYGRPVVAPPHATALVQGLGAAGMPIFPRMRPPPG